jgi:hypothetical protein
MHLLKSFVMCYKMRINVVKKSISYFMKFFNLLFTVSGTEKKLRTLLNTTGLFKMIYLISNGYMLLILGLINIICYIK